MDVTKIARIAGVNGLKKRKYFSRVARVQQSSHDLSPTGPTSCRNLRTEISTASAGNDFRSLSELVRCPSMFMWRFKFAVTRTDALLPSG
jgi:hypothetical protein